MTDLLLVEKVARAMCADAGIDPDKIGAYMVKLPGKEYREFLRGPMWENYTAPATAAIATVEAHRPPGTGYEAGLVEGFKQGIEAAAKVAESLPLDWRDGTQPGPLSAYAHAVREIVARIRALSPPSIADDGKEGAG